MAKFEEVPVDALRPHPLNEAIYDPSDDRDFLANVKKHGIAPIVAKSDGTIISGHRRWRAAKELGMETVPVIREDPSNDLLAIIAFNHQRKKTDAEITREFTFYEAEIAKLRKEAAARKSAGIKLDSPNGEPVKRERSRRTVARLLNIGDKKADCLLKLNREEEVRDEETGELRIVKPHSDLIGKLSTGEIPKIAIADRIRRERENKVNEHTDSNPDEESAAAERLSQIIGEAIDRALGGESKDSVVEWAVDNIMSEFIEE